MHISDEQQIALSDDKFDISESYAAQERALGIASWDDPAMDAYNDYDSHRTRAGGAING